MCTPRQPTYSEALEALRKAYEREKIQLTAHISTLDVLISQFQREIKILREDRLMPNWCENRVTVSGNTEEVQKFIETVKSNEEEFSFNAIVPMPEELRDVCSPTLIVETEKEVEEYKESHKDIIHFAGGSPITQTTFDRLVEEHGFPNWYDWAEHHWGCKWDTRWVTVIDSGEDFIEYGFDTPWCPPEPIYHKLIENFPGLMIDWFYDEPGTQATGYLHSKDYLLPHPIQLRTTYPKGI